MGLPTGDVDNMQPPPMPGRGGDGPPPLPPGSAPAAGGAEAAPTTAVEETNVTEMPPKLEETAKEPVPQTQASETPPAAPFDKPDTGGSQLAPRGDRRGMAAQGGPAAIASELAELGFDGVDFTGFGVFPIVSLQKETFKSTEGDILGASFRGYVQGSRKKWIYKNGLIDQDPNSDFFYTYDDELTIKGEPIAEKLAGWKQRGWNYLKNPYVEVFIALAEGEKEGQIVALSIPKTSIQRYSNFMLRLYSKGTDNMQHTLCEFGQGNEVTGPKIKNPWIPLDFKILG